MINCDPKRTQHFLIIRLLSAKSKWLDSWSFEAASWSCMINPHRILLNLTHFLKIYFCLYIIRKNKYEFIFFLMIFVLIFFFEKLNLPEILYSYHHNKAMRKITVTLFTITIVSLSAYRKFHHFFCSERSSWSYTKELNHY